MGKDVENGKKEGEGRGRGEREEGEKGDEGRERKEGEKEIFVNDEINGHPQP